MTYAVEGNTVWRALLENLGGTTFQRQSIERASGAVGIRVAGREDGRDQERVHQAGKTRNAHVRHGDDIRRSRSGTAGARRTSQEILKGLIVVRDDDTDGQRAADEEEAKSPVDVLESGLDVGARSLRLGGHHGDVLRTDDGETGGPKAGKPAFEQPKRACGTSRWCERAWIIPVSEAVRIALRVAANHGDLRERQRWFCFSVGFLAATA